MDEEEEAFPDQFQDELDQDMIDEGVVTKNMDAYDVIKKSKSNLHWTMSNTTDDEC